MLLHKRADAAVLIADQSKDEHFTEFFGRRIGRAPGTGNAAAGTGTHQQQANESPQDVVFHNRTI